MRAFRQHGNHQAWSVAENNAALRISQLRNSVGYRAVARWLTRKQWISTALRRGCGCPVNRVGGDQPCQTGRRHPPAVLGQRQDTDVY